jgi:thioredoxin-related protein
MYAKVIRILLIILGIVISVSGLTTNCIAADREPIYDTSGNAKEQIADALKIAKQDNKRVLLQYGGNWCGWCYLMHDMFAENKEIAKTLLYEYELVLVDTQTNPTIAEQYQSPIKEKGVPYFTVLDADGKVVTHQDTGSLEDGAKHDPAKVLAFLETWKAEPQDAADVFADAKKLAVKEDKKIVLKFGAPWCIWCTRLDAFMHQGEMESILEKDFVLVKIDVDRMTGAKEFYADIVKQSGTQPGGIPWFAVTDAEGKPLITSNEPEHGNVGFPVRDFERAHFINMLKNNSKRITTEEMDRVAQALDEATKQDR